MEDNLKYFCKWKTNKNKLEDDLKYFCELKMNSNIFLLMEDDLKLLKLKIEDVH